MPVDEDHAPPFDGTESDLPPAGSRGPSPVSSIIRPQLWVHWTITLLCLVAWGGMLYLGDLAERTDFGLRDILGLRSGRVTNFFSTLMLLWAGQLSLLIYWYRRKSRNDFAGRYRMWLWIGGMLQFFLVVTATGAHRPFSQYMQRMWPMDIPMYALLSWLVPVATLALAMYRMLRIELKRHRSGKFLLRLAGLAASVAAATLIVGPLLPVRVRDLLEIGSATLAHLALATALLMHARFVVHISNEVPRRQRVTRRALAALRTVASYLPLPRIRRPQLSLRLAGVGRAILSAAWVRQGRLSKVLRTLALPSLAKFPLPRLTLPKFSLSRLPRLSGKDKKAPRRESNTAKPASERSAKKSVDASSRSQKPQTPPQQVSVATDSGGGRPAAPRVVLTSRKAPPKQPADQEHHRVDAAEPPRGPRRAPVTTRSSNDILDRYGADEDIDDETLRSLSKKQRRKLRKKQRELQRTGR